MTLKNSKLALPGESERLAFVMMKNKCFWLEKNDMIKKIIWWIINGFIDVSTADIDGDPDTYLFHQNL